MASEAVTAKVKALAAADFCWACGQLQGAAPGRLVAKRRREDGSEWRPGAIKVGRWTYGLYHELCEVPRELRP